MRAPELKYRLLQQLIDGPRDEYGVTKLGEAVGADPARVLKAIAELVRDIAAPLGLHASEGRQGLRALTQDGFVTPRETPGRTTFILARDPATLALVREGLRGAIERSTPR